MAGNPCRPVVLTIGNEFLGDDGAGILFGRLLATRNDVAVIEGGTVPENVLDKVIRENPSFILIADAADFGGKPGDYQLLECDRLTGGQISTHGTTDLCIQYLRASTDADIYMLGFQPSHLSFGAGVSTEVFHGIENAIVRCQKEALEMFITSCRKADVT